MNTIVKSSNGITLVPTESRLLSKRKIYLQGEINNDSACEFAKSLMILASESRSEPIDLLINSPGGEVKAGMLIYDLIQTCETPIRMICLGRAFSMAGIIFLSGNHGRYMLANSEIMLHEPLISSGVGGNSSSIKSISDSLIQTKSKMNKIVADKTGHSLEEVDKETEYDHYFTAEESIDFGLADKIIGFEEIMEVKI